MFTLKVMYFSTLVTKTLNTREGAIMEYFNIMNDMCVEGTGSNLCLQDIISNIYCEEFKANFGTVTNEELLPVFAKYCNEVICY